MNPPSAPPAKRSYGQYEPTARALDIVGERWTLLLVRELLHGPQRFTDLRGGLPGIGPNVLAERLRHLVETGVIRRVALPPPAASTVYELTDRGQELRPVVDGLTRFGMQFLGFPTAGDRFRLSWLMRSLEATFRPESAVGVRESYEFRLDGEIFHVRIDDGRAEFRQGPATDPAWIVTTDVTTFIGMGAKIIDGADAWASGRATFEGDPEAGMRSVELLGPHLGSLGGPGGALGAVQDRVRPEAAVGVTESYEFRTEGKVFHVSVDDGSVEVRPGAAEAPAAVFSADLGTFVAMFMGNITAEEAVANALVEFQGDPDAGRRAWEIIDIRPEAQQ